MIVVEVACSTKRLMSTIWQQTPLLVEECLMVLAGMMTERRCFKCDYAKCMRDYSHCLCIIYRRGVLLSPPRGCRVQLGFYSSRLSRVTSLKCRLSKILKGLHYCSVWRYVVVFSAAVLIIMPKSGFSDTNVFIFCIYLSCFVQFPRFRTEIYYWTEVAV